jgi:hypothetical protein
MNPADIQSVQANTPARAEAAGPSFRSRSRLRAYCLWIVSLCYPRFGSGRVSAVEPSRGLIRCSPTHCTAPNTRQYCDSTSRHIASPCGSGFFGSSAESVGELASIIVPAEPAGRRSSLPYPSNGVRNAKLKQDDDDALFFGPSLTFETSPVTCYEDDGTR